MYLLDAQVSSSSFSVSLMSVTYPKIGPLDLLMPMPPLYPFITETVIEAAVTTLAEFIFLKPRNYGQIVQLGSYVNGGSTISAGT